MTKNLFIGLVAAACILSAVLISQKSNAKDQFTLWKQNFTATWDQQEEQYRRIIFFKNLDKINKHNSDLAQTYKMGVNQFTVYSDTQFRNIFLNPKVYNPEWKKVDVNMPNLSADIDWTAQGVVSPVKNQGGCGSCWAFSAVATLQSFSIMSKGTKVTLSEQQLVDCSDDYGNNGCDGGQIHQALDYVKDNGITTSAAYPYTAKTGSCITDGGSFKIKDYNSATGCSDILTALAGRPIGVSVDADNWAHYASGIFSNCDTTLDHAVFLVGATNDYWKIKNSWGTTWGESGFIRIKSGNTCGVCQDISPWPV